MAVSQPNVSNVSVNNPQPIVGQILTGESQTNSTFYSSKLVNYIESFEVDGNLKSVFFSEVSTNVNVGDRVFILNGNYDSGEFIKNNKYKKYSDGYRVLAVEGCRIVLDINFTGIKPFESYTTKNFIYVHHIQSQKEFDYINTLAVSIDGNKTIINNFSGTVNPNTSNLKLNLQSIIFASKAFNGGSNVDYQYTNVTNEGFWACVSDGITNTWFDVTDKILSNSIEQNPNYSTSGDIYIIGEDIYYQDYFFRERGIYKYENYAWVFDTRYYPAYISKVNFRFGKFRGNFNDGVFGTYLRKNTWEDAKWNSGVFLNSVWKNGLMNSKHTIDELSYNCFFKLVGSISTIFQTLDATNNRGFGYNFIEDSIFETFVITNGNFKNCNFSTTFSSKSAIDIFNNISTGFTDIINGGKFELCDIYNVNSSGGYFLNSSIENSNLSRSKVVSSEVVSSSINRGSWSTEGGIRVLGADLWSYEFNEDQLLGTTFSDIRGTLKLYISEEDYFKLEKGDTFYLSKLNKEFVYNLLDDEQRILFGLENRFLLDNYSDNETLTNTRKKFYVSLKSSNENKYKTYVTTSPNPLLQFVDVIDGDDKNFWVKIPNNLPSTQSQLRGRYDVQYEIGVGYLLGDFVYETFVSGSNAIYSFYQYWPIDRNTGSRAQNQTEAINFSTNFLGQGLTVSSGYSDWFFVGTYSGVWSSTASYNGFLYPEIINPYSPFYPEGSIVSDQNLTFNNWQSTSFWIFIGDPATNKSKQQIVNKFYKSLNFATFSNVNLPSIDITTNLFGWYKDFNDEIVYESSYALKPIVLENVSKIFTDTILGNGDFKSGIFNNSTWLSGDNTNYLFNKLLPDQFGQVGNQLILPTRYLINLLTGTKNQLVVTLLESNRYGTDTYDGYDYRVGDIVWINSIDYVINNLTFNIDGRYKVTKILTGQLFLVCDEVTDKLFNLSSGGAFVTPKAQNNNYHSLNKLLIKDSKIISGKFQRTGFVNCTFENEFFTKYTYPAQDVTNTERIRLVNTLFNRTSNKVKTGLVYKSHFVDDVFDGGTFYNSIWLGGDFSDGLFKFSVWTGGNFNNGKFVDSRESTIFTFDYDYSRNNKLWQGGVFNGGDFYNSLWVKGTFNDGNFYFSDWTGGIWNNGILGKKDLRAIETTLAYYGPTTSFGATFTIWNNGVVENGMVGGQGRVDWYNGRMLSGVFSSEARTNTTYAEWHDGEFYGSSFTKEARWRNGKFYSGKFLSEYGWKNANFLTHSNNPLDYGWGGGEFFGGEFGMSSTFTNSVWFDGVMHGGMFMGRFWRDGVFLNGNFYGSLDKNKESNEGLLDYKTGFYGLWNNGHVNNLLYDVKKDRLFITEQTQLSNNSNKKKLLNANLYNVSWKNGTFSHENGMFNDSMWLGGEFKFGEWNNSVFNPFVDLTLSGLKVNDFKKIQKYLALRTDLEAYRFFILTNIGGTIDTNQIITTVISTVDSYNNDPTFPMSFVIDFDEVNIAIYPPPYSSLTFPYTSYTGLNITTNNTIVMRIYDSSVVMNDPTQYIYFSLYIYSAPNDYDSDVEYFASNSSSNPYSFNRSTDCKWTNGNFNSGEFYYSTWNSGNFNDGTMSGAIWKDGVFNYGSMNNCYWENGIWRNGNWDGTPFDYKSYVEFDPNFFIIEDKKTYDMIENIATYSANYKLHLSNVIVRRELTESQENNFLPINGFVSMTYSIDSSSDINKVWKTADFIYPTTSTSGVLNWHYYNEGILNSYKIYITHNDGTINIFRNINKGYRIVVDMVFREYLTQPTEDGFISIEVGCGNNPTFIKKYPTTNLDEAVRLELFYQMTDFGQYAENAKNFWIRKIGTGVLKIINVVVTFATFEYDSELNNSLYSSGPLTFNLIPRVNNNKEAIQKFLGGKDGSQIRYKFGNGVFKSGIWKTGVWNDGWRGKWEDFEDDIFYFDSINLNTYQSNKNQWFLKIDSNTNVDNYLNLYSNLKINDYITIGNVVGIDMNEERYLLKDFYRITDIVVSGTMYTITIDIPISKFPLRRFEKDSNEHLIYVTKNIWLGGTFLNGHFRGIWNYGLFKGYPFTTVMKDSHFVSGKIDGGRFISGITSITASDGTSKSYNTGLVQFMEFFDNNVSEKEGDSGLIDNTYQSWIDVNYYTQSFVNVNDTTTIFDQNFGKRVPLPNLYGYPTKDVLSSYSKFKNTTNTEIDYYNLGLKYRLFTDHLEDSSYFRKPFNSEGKPGLDEFLLAGWTANTGNFYNTPTASFVYNSNITRRNFNRITIVLATFGYNILNNNKISVPDKRYTLVEYDLEYYQRGEFNGKYTNSFSRPLNLLGSNYNSVNNVYKSGIVKTEFFYNKNALDLVLRYNSEFQPPTESIAMFGYNVTHSIPPAGEILGSYATTYSMIMPSTSSQYSGPGYANTAFPVWDENTTYDKYQIVRDPTKNPDSDSLGYYFISLQNNNLNNPLVGNPNKDLWWAQTLVGFNRTDRENTILEQSNVFAFYTQFRMSYIRFWEIDALPFFKYFDFEINFVDTFNFLGNVGLEFTKPHGLKKGDKIFLRLDETRYNPQYETQSTIQDYFDGRLPGSTELVYQVRTDIPYGITVSYLGESGAVVKIGGDRIDRRIQTNWVGTSPKIQGLDENFIYLGNNQIFLDRESF